MATERDYQSLYDRIAALRESVAGRLSSDLIQNPQLADALTKQIDDLLQSVVTADAAAKPPPDQGLAQLAGVGPEAATEFKVDLQLDPGAAVKIRVTDATGNPLMGVSVSGLTSLGYFVTESDAVVTAVNLGPQETRVVLLEKKERNLGRVLTIGPDEIRAGEAIAQLQPCAKITGQVFLDDGTPFSGLADLK